MNPVRFFLVDDPLVDDDFVTFTLDTFSFFFDYLLCSI